MCEREEIRSTGSRTSRDLELDGFLSKGAGTWQDRGPICDLQMRKEIVRIDVELRETENVKSEFLLTCCEDRPRPLSPSILHPLSRIFVPSLLTN